MLLGGLPVGSEYMGLFSCFSAFCLSAWGGILLLSLFLIPFLVFPCFCLLVIFLYVILYGLAKYGWEWVIRGNGTGMQVD